LSTNVDSASSSLCVNASDGEVMTNASAVEVAFWMSVVFVYV
jgi:hypothetical protein